MQFIKNKENDSGTLCRCYSTLLNHLKGKHIFLLVQIWEHSWNENLEKELLLTMQLEIYDPLVTAFAILINLDHSCPIEIIKNELQIIRFLFEKSAKKKEIYEKRNLFYI